MIIDKNYWNNKYKNHQTGWDIGHISTPIKEYVQQLSNPNISILIPGAGNAWEAEYLYQQKFERTHIIDISEEAVSSFLSRVPQFPKHQIFNTNFFNHTSTYELIIEQTFLSALPPSLRKDYVKKMHELLVPGGKLIGVIFNKEFNNDFPPYGGKKEEYISLFKPYFTIKVMEEAYNSIPPRAGSELFLILEKK